jgi:hypothetical protein
MPSEWGRVLASGKEVAEAVALAETLRTVMLSVLALSTPEGVETLVSAIVWTPSVRGGSGDVQVASGEARSHVAPGRSRGRSSM